MSEITPIFQGEVMFAGWSESHSTGAKITLWLSDPNDLDAFRLMTAKKSNLSGQRLMAVFVEIGEDEKPVTQKLSQQAALLCKSMGFQQFAESKLGYAVERSDQREVVAINFLRRMCGIASRAELDTDGKAGMKYQQLLADYRDYSTQP